MLLQGVIKKYHPQSALDLVGNAVLLDDGVRE